MNTSLVDGYRGVRQGAIALALGATVTLGGVLGAFAADGTFDEGGQVKSGGYEEYEYAAGPVRGRPTTDTSTPTRPARTARATTSPTTAPSGASYYTWEDQPADYKWEPAAVTYGESQYVFYAGEDSKYYLQRLRRLRVGGWEDISGEYEFAVRPVRQRLRRLPLRLRHRHRRLRLRTSPTTAPSGRTGRRSTRTTRPPVPAYAIEWDGYNNVFWTGKDGKVYWNRYDGDRSGPAPRRCRTAEEYEYADAPYAIGYRGRHALRLRHRPRTAPRTGTPSTARAGAGGRPTRPRLRGRGQVPAERLRLRGVQHVVYTAEDGHAYYTTLRRRELERVARPGRQLRLRRLLLRVRRTPTT